MPDSTPDPIDNRYADRKGEGSMSQQMDFVREMVRKMSAGMLNTGDLDVEKCRRVLGQSYANGQAVPGVTIEKTVFDGVEVSCFVPEQKTSENIIYYVHGGGLITGDRTTAEPYASELALHSGCMTIACSYRLAPEDPFPAGFDDSYQVYKYLLEHYPESKVSLIGDSGGAYLSLAMAIRARDEGIRQPSAVVLNSVVADMSGAILRHNTEEETTVSVEGLEALKEIYAAAEDLTNPYVSPILADYHGLSPLRVIYDEGEVLAVDSLEVAKKAKEAGCEVEVQSYNGCFHAFTTTGSGTPESAEEMKESIRFMKEHME